MVTAQTQPRRRPPLSRVPAWVWVGLAALTVRLLAVWDLALRQRQAVEAGSR